jgi:hypothetical protein
MSGANYNGRQPNNSSYIKNFVFGQPPSLWKAINYLNPSGTITQVITPSSNLFKDVYLPGNLYIDGNIINPSDIILKENISEVDESVTNKLLNLNVKSFTYKKDSEHQIHYGFIAQEFEKEYDELVTIKPDINYKNIKAINYLEIIPLLVSKIQMMQKEIDSLKGRIEDLEIYS